MSALEKEILIMEKECDIDITESINCDEYNDAIIAFLEEGEDAAPVQKEKSGNVIVKIVNSLLSFLKRAWASIRNKLKAKEHITMDDFQNSELGKQMIQSDLGEINKRVEDEIRKKRKFVQFASKVSGADDRDVENLLDTAVVKGREKAPIYVPMAVAMGQVKIANRQQRAIEGRLTALRDGADWDAMTRDEKKAWIQQAQYEKALYSGQAKSAAKIVGKL